MLMGTSMATPVVSGNAALVRQYLTDGWYPTGVNQTSNAYTRVSSSLLKGKISLSLHLTIFSYVNSLDCPCRWECTT